MGSPAALVVDSLPGLHPAGSLGLVSAGVQVAVEAREVTGRNLQPDAAPFKKTLLVTPAGSSSGFSSETR